ncbi:MAG: tetratricopeptide repeat protein [Bacteroidota bacterium]|nr:tetratricopeptide repeat protein [Bacteroidota bacterium]
MAAKKAHTNDVDVVERARGFWAKYNKPISYIGSVIVILFVGWMIYKYMFKVPKQEKADKVVFVTQKYFSEFSTATDSAKILLATKVLNGDGRNPGALRIINEYSGTPAANLCEYYAGTCYLQLGQYAKSIRYLKDFDANGADQIKSRALGMMGDASAELNKNDDALDYYQKASNVNEKDTYTSSEFLFRAALFAQSIGKQKEAIDLFKKLKTEYPLTEKAADADKYLARLGQFSE